MIVLVNSISIICYLSLNVGERESSCNVYTLIVYKKFEPHIHTSIFPKLLTLDVFNKLYSSQVNSLFWISHSLGKCLTLFSKSQINLRRLIFYHTKSERPIIPTPISTAKFYITLCLNILLSIDYRVYFRVDANSWMGVRFLLHLNRSINCTRKV